MCNNVWSIKVFLGWTWSNVCAGGFNWFLLSTSDLKILISISSCFQLCYSQPIFQRTAWILANTLFYKVKGWTPFPSPRLTLMTRDAGHPLKLGTKIELVAIPSAATEEQNRHRKNWRFPFRHGGIPKSSISDWNFPSKKPSSNGATPMTSWSFRGIGVLASKPPGPICALVTSAEIQAWLLVLSKSFLWLKQ